MNFPETTVKLTGLKCPGSSFLPFLKMDARVTFLQLRGSSLDLHNLSKVRVASQRHLPTLSAHLDAHRQHPWTCVG